MMNTTNQAALIATKFAATAVGELYKELGFMQRTNLWRTNDVKENGNFEVPVIGQNLVANDRTGGGDTVDQTPDADTVPVTLVEKHVAFPIDLNWYASENGQMTIMTNLQNAIKVLAKKVHTEVFKTVALTAGLSSTGTLGSTLVLADWDYARQTLVEQNADNGNFAALISPKSMNDLKAIAEFATFNVTGIPGAYPDGMVAKADGFTIMETPRLHIPAAGQTYGIAGDFKGITTVFPKQKLFNSGDNFKIEQELDGIRYTVLQEYVPGKGGAWRWVVMATFGAAVSDPRLLVLLKTR
jgi:hypothetical protein